MQGCLSLPLSRMWLTSARLLSQKKASLSRVNTGLGACSPSGPPLSLLLLLSPYLADSCILSTPTTSFPHCFCASSSCRLACSSFRSDLWKRTLPWLPVTRDLVCIPAKEGNTALNISPLLFSCFLHASGATQQCLTSLVSSVASLQPPLKARKPSLSP